MARRLIKEGGNYLEQESSKQKTMESIDGGIHPAVDGQSLGKRWKVRWESMHMHIWANNIHFLMALQQTCFYKYSFETTRRRLDCLHKNENKTKHSNEIDRATSLNKHYQEMYYVHYISQNHVEVYGTKLLCKFCAYSRLLSNDNNNSNNSNTDLSCSKTNGLVLAVAGREEGGGGGLRRRRRWQNRRRRRRRRHGRRRRRRRRRRKRIRRRTTTTRTATTITITIVIIASAAAVVVAAAAAAAVATAAAAAAAIVKHLEIAVRVWTCNHVVVINIFLDCSCLCVRSCFPPTNGPQDIERMAQRQCRHCCKDMVYL